MKVKDLKWYSPFLFFGGAILSFADPITDILTLVEFYRTDHKTWFGVGLTFVLLPCLVFPLLFFVFRLKKSKVSPSECAKTVLCAFHPFSTAFARTEAFIFSLKKWCFEDKIDGASVAKADNLLQHMSIAVLFEAVLESAPQFVLQLYAISVQEEPVTIIQVISLSVSFLTLAWAFTATDKWFLVELGIISDFGDLKVKHKAALYVTHLLLLSSRLLAICYFIVSYKWWVIGVLSFHSCVVALVSFILDRREWRQGRQIVFMIVSVGIYWLRDYCTPIIVKVKGVSVIVLLSHLLFVLENYSMILIFYFTYDVKTWYSLPVTVFVCVSSVLGSKVRIWFLYWLNKDSQQGLSIVNRRELFPKSNCRLRYGDVNTSVENRLYESSV